MIPPPNVTGSLHIGHALDNTLQDVLKPKGVAVVIEAVHQCMTTRGVHKTGVSMVTSRMLGAFRDDASTRREFMAMIQGNRGVGSEG